MIDVCMCDRTSMFFKTSSFTLLILIMVKRAITECVRMSTLKHELPSTVFNIMKHNHYLFILRDSRFVIYSLV